MLPQLNLPDHSFRFKSAGQRKYIFDNIRKRYVLLTPEEWVRQNMAAYLVNEKKFPSSLMAVEMPLHINGMEKRADIVLFSRSGTPVMIVECKAPGVSLAQKAFDQAAMYNIHMKVEYLVVSNGIIHYCAKLDHVAGSWAFLGDIPAYMEIQSRSG